MVGIFLSPDVKEGNAQGMNPYAYVAQNPETLTDPSGQMIDCGPGCGNGTPPPPPNHGPVPCTWQGCQNGNSGSSGNNSSSKKHENPSGCDPNTNQSIACHAWAYDAGQVRSNRLTTLNRKAYIELVAGYLLFLAGDILNLWKGSALDKVDALLDILTEIVDTIVPAVGYIFGGSIEATALRFASWASRIEATLQPIAAAFRYATPWEEIPLDISANLITASAGGPAGVFVQVLIMALKPIAGYLLDSGAHYLQSLAFTDFAEEQRESDMPLQDWCEQYGGCPSYSSYH